MGSAELSMGMKLLARTALLILSICSVGAAPTTAPGSVWCHKHNGSMIPDGFGNSACGWPTFDSCDQNIQCDVDPRDAVPGQYGKWPSSVQDIIQSLANAEGRIVSECTRNNTGPASVLEQQVYKQPRCTIKSGPFKNQIGICIWDGQEVEGCLPFGQHCVAALPGTGNEGWCPTKQCDPYAKCKVDRDCFASEGRTATCGDGICCWPSNPTCQEAANV